LVADRLRKDGLKSFDGRCGTIVDIEALGQLGQFQPFIPASMPMPAEEVAT
jgi:hypothetical protein